MLGKQLNPASEAGLYKKWEAEKLHSFNAESSKPIYSIDTPPPYTSGEWHIGAVAAYSLCDMAARVQRMRGCEVLFPFCLDKNGINIELVVEKKFKKHLHEFNRAQFIELCQKEVQPFCKSIHDLAKRIGMSVCFEKPLYYETDSPEYRAVSQALFIDLFKNGFVHEDLRPNFFCPKCRTTIAEAEICYEERPTALNTLKFKVKETGEELLIATTRPELLCACKAVLVHPDDERYKKLVGKTAVTPIYGAAVPIKAHAYVQPEFGTGIVMVCSFGDSADVQLFRELGLEPVKAIDETNKMTQAAGAYAGLTPGSAREAIIKDLQKQGLLVKQEQTTHRTPVCERSKTPLEFVLMKEWYVKQKQCVSELKKKAAEMEFHPEKYRQVLLDWIDSLTIDWPVSRRRYYHTEIPLWYCKKCNAPFTPPPGKYYQPWRENPPAGSKCKCGCAEFVGETRVFDTWMDSSISNFYVAGCGWNEKLFKKAFPVSLRPQGREIIRTWLYYSLLKSLLLADSKPFKHVMVNGMGLDEHGRAMHKSAGNIIHPGPVLEKHGADAFRLWAASEVSLGEDFRISEPRIAGAAKFLTKLWNVSKFITNFPEKPQPAKLKPADEWMLAQLNTLVAECNASYDNYDFFPAANKIRDFVWNVFAPHYLEMVKARAYAGDESALFALHFSLKTMLRLLAPITPFMTDAVFREAYGTTVHKQDLPLADKRLESKLAGLTQALVEFNSKTWTAKKEAGLSLNAEFKAAVPKELAAFADDLKTMHKLKGS